MGMFIISWAVLTGTPITGALLGKGDINGGEPGGGYHWSRAIIFSGVSLRVAWVLVSPMLMDFFDQIGCAFCRNGLYDVRQIFGGKAEGDAENLNRLISRPRMIYSTLLFKLIGDVMA
jgi:hypothetical protein